MILFHIHDAILAHYDSILNSIKAKHFIPYQLCRRTRRGHQALANIPQNPTLLLLEWTFYSASVMVFFTLMTLKFMFDSYR